MEDIQLQLKTVDQALSEVTSESDRTSLLDLKQNLLELLDLTRQITSEIDENENKNVPTLKETGCTELQNESEGSGDKLCYDEGNEFAEVIKEGSNEADVMDLKEKLESMIGQKCSAPHKHSWGAVGYHNAIICGLGDSAELTDEHVLSGILVRVLYTNPTHKEMLPCSYFLEGECKFNDANCHYSHGELVPFSELREYTEPAFEKLRRNCVVLAKMQDRLWHKGRVLCSNFVEKKCSVLLEDNKHKKKEEDFNFENLFPLYDEDDESSSGEDDKRSDIGDSNDLDATKQTCLIEKNLFTYPIGQPLGEWEKYTRGIGSKLMAKMGYKQGTGLGWNSQGITTPISAHILPQGCSLDYCMELREAAAEDCKDLFSVEKKLKRQQKKLEERNARAYEREKQRTDVFSFLNESIFSGKRSSPINASCSSASSSKMSLEYQTTKSLNVESVRISDNIHKKMREIVKLEQSMNRNGKNTEIYKRLQAQLNSCSEELLTLKQVEKSLAKEQTTRKTRDKLCIF